MLHIKNMDSRMNGKTLTMLGLPLNWSNKWCLKKDLKLGAKTLHDLKRYDRCYYAFIIMWLPTNASSCFTCYTRWWDQRFRETIVFVEWHQDCCVKYMRRHLNWNTMATQFDFLLLKINTSKIAKTKDGKAVTLEQKGRLLGVRLWSSKTRVEGQFVKSETLKQSVRSRGADR